MKRKYVFDHIVAEALLISLYMRAKESRWGFFFGQILGRMTRLCYGVSSMLGYRIENNFNNNQ